jgi:succinate dehydrogenase / fumarate reductase membrane anchor subunit
MVTSATSLTGSGLSDFLIQRVSAVVLAVYTFCVLGFFLANPGITHEQLLDYFSSLPMVIFSTLMVLCMAAHAWIGMWTIGTDYIHDHYFGQHSTAFRMVYSYGCMLLLFVYVVWALKLFWSL